MEVYANGMTIEKSAEFDKELVRRALAGELVYSDESAGYTYKKAPSEECKGFILDVFDKWACLSFQLAASSGALTNIMQSNGMEVKNHFDEYLAEMDKELSKYNEYLYEHELEALHEQADALLNEDLEDAHVLTEKRENVEQQVKESKMKTKYVVSSYDSVTSLLIPAAVFNNKDDAEKYAAINFGSITADDDGVSLIHEVVSFCEN